MGTRTTWQLELSVLLRDNGETWDDVEASTLTPEELTLSFDSGYGRTNGPAFTVWTKRYVYFPICYDGSEWVGFVARNPDGRPTFHQGG